MLADGIKGLHMTIAAADEGQGVSHVFDGNGVGIHIRDVKMLSRIGRNQRWHRSAFLLPRERWFQYVLYYIRRFLYLEHMFSEAYGWLREQSFYNHPIYN